MPHSVLCYIRVAHFLKITVCFLEGKVNEVHIAVLAAGCALSLCLAQPSLHIRSHLVMCEADVGAVKSLGQQCGAPRD